MFSKKPTPPVVTTTTPQPENRRFTDNLGGQVTNIGNDITVRGDILGKDNVELSGKIEGNVNLESTLTVLKTGSVTGDVLAQNVVILGTVKGDVQAKHKIELRDACQVTGNLQAGTIAISEGAFFQGTVKMLGTSSKPADPLKFSEKRAETTPTPNR